MNTNIEALQGIVEALEKHDYIVDVVENEDGYTINFAKGDSITIKNGKDGANGNDGANGADGADGQTPVIGVAEEDGVYYWTVNGEWLTDANGNKIKAVGSDGANGADGNDGDNGANGANGNDGVTPQLKIENNKWFVSYDEGTTWVELGVVAEGDVVVANPIEVTEDEKCVYFKLSDDQVITIAKVTPLEIEFESISDAVTGSLVKVGYTITTTAESVEIEAIAAKNVADVEVVKGEGNTGVINITVGENEGESKVLVFVGDETRVIMRSITINLEKAAIEFATEDNATIAVGAEGGNVALKFLTNVDVKVVESADWIEEASTRAMVEKTVDLTVLANESTERSAEVVIEAVDSPALSIKYVINQEGKPEEPEAEVLATLDAEAYYLFKQATEIKGGKWYAIVSEANAATALTGNYGYLQITQAMARTEGISLPASCAFGFMTTEGGYTIQQYDAKYVYQTGTYNSFNVSATAPEDGGVWSVAVDGNAFSITNNSVSKTIQYDSKYHSYGSYADITATIPTLYELVEVDTTPMITDLSTNSISVACDGGNSTVTVSTYGESTLSVSDDADWVSTSISDNVVTITVDANSGAAREANVTITYGEDSKSVAIAQAEFKEEGETSTYTDTLTSSMFAATSSTYTAFSGVEGTNGAVYAGKSAKSQNGGYIQLRSSKSEDGIVTTTSGGKVKKVVVEWDESNTAAGRTLDVYVSKTAYTSATELYNTVVGEKVGGIVKGTSTELTIDGDYEYLGLRSNSGAMYIKSITITYEK